MIRYTKPDATDDDGYLDWVEAVMVGVEEAIKTDQTYVVKIDNWFGRRWLGFSVHEAYKIQNASDPRPRLP